MNSSSENIIIAVIYFIAGIYALLTGIGALANLNIKIPGFYQFGIFLSNKLRGKEKINNFEIDIMERRKAIRYGIFWIFIGLISIAGGVFLLFVR
jgi:hypothetical protein